MLFRIVRPVKRSGSRNLQFVQRIPKDVLARARGLTLHVPCGDEQVSLTLPPNALFVRFSLRTHDDAEAKIRTAQAAVYLERVWQGLRKTKPATLTHKQAKALSGDLYFAWAEAERQTTTAAQWDANQKTFVPAINSPDEERVYFASAAAPIAKALENENLTVLEAKLGKLIDRILLAKGIGEVDEQSRLFLLIEAGKALRDAFRNQERQAGGDYSPDPNANRFPEWSAPEAPASAPRATPSPKVSLTALVEDWWREAKAAGGKSSTHESYRNSIRHLVRFLKHDDASRVTREDVVRFKDHRLATTNRRNGKAISPKTVKDSDLAALKSVFGWGKSNGKLASNPAEGVTIKLGKRRSVRTKSFLDAEAKAILAAALAYEPKAREKTKTSAARRWVPWLLAYTGARLGEIAQLRKQDVWKDGDDWFITITPEAGTVKTDEAREVPLHAHLVAQGFCDFVAASDDGHLFLQPSRTGDVLGPWRGLKNRLANFARSVVTDENVAPNHAWRHRFKTIGREAGIDARIIDAIQGHAPRTEGERYGEVSRKARAAAMRKFPAIDLDTREADHRSGADEPAPTATG